jgi:hypothetical protein
LNTIIDLNDLNNLNDFNNLNDLNNPSFAHIVTIVMDTTDTKPCFSKLKVVYIPRDREHMNETLYQSTVQLGEDIFLSSGNK